MYSLKDQLTKKAQYEKYLYPLIGTGLGAGTGAVISKHFLGQPMLPGAIGGGIAGLGVGIGSIPDTEKKEKPGKEKNETEKDLNPYVLQATKTKDPYIARGIIEALPKTERERIKEKHPQIKTDTSWWHYPSLNESLYYLLNPSKMF